MPKPSPAWSLCRVHGTWRNYDGTLKGGSWKATIPVWAIDAVDDSIFPPGTVAQGPLNTAVTDVNLDGYPDGPSLDTQLPVTDDPDIAADDWFIDLEVTFADGTPSVTYVFPVLTSSIGNGINLLTITPQELIAGADARLASNRFPAIDGGTP